MMEFIKKNNPFKKNNVVIPYLSSSCRPKHPYSSFFITILLKELREGRIFKAQINFIGTKYNEVKKLTKVA
jgi:hypothetical protein